MYLYVYLCCVRLTKTIERYYCSEKVFTTHKGHYLFPATHYNRRAISSAMSGDNKAVTDDCDAAAAMSQGSGNEAPISVIIVGGKPGSGKSTACKQFCAEQECSGEGGESKKFVTVSAGDLVRDRMKNGTLAQADVEKMERGDMIDDATILRIIEDYLRQQNPGETVLLDGFPRNCDQLDAMRALERRQTVRLLGVMEIAVDDATCFARLNARKRADDDPKVIEKRIGRYSSSTAAMIEKLRGEGGTYCPVDGVGSPEEVLKRVSAAIGKLASAHI